MKKNKIIKTLSIALLGSTILTTGIAPLEAHAAWKQNNTGWWYTEGNSWATGWRQISGVWYYFDGNGYMKTGWVNDKGTWYYMDKSGAMKTGWVNDRGTWYFMAKSGAMQTGWINDKGTWYYLETSGAMKTGWLSYQGHWYFLKASGAMASDEFITDKGKEYYLYRSGAMRTGWAPHGDYMCYLEPSTGEMVTGLKVIEGDTYYFKQNGEPVTGVYKIDNKDYYFSTEGKLVKNYKSLFITSNDKGIVTKYDIDAAKKAILTNDSNIIQRYEKELGKVELIYPETIGIFDVGYGAFRSYGVINDEMCIGFTLDAIEIEEASNIGCYLVGVETGKVYALNNQGGCAFYEIKDNKIVKTYKDVNGVSSDWR